MSCNADECFCGKEVCVHQEVAQEAKEVVQESLPEYTADRDVIGICMACFNSGCNGLCQTECGKQAIYYGNYDYCRKRD